MGANPLLPEALSAAESTALAAVSRACDVGLGDLASARQCADYAASALSAAYDRSESRGKLGRSEHLAGVVRSKIPAADVLRPVSSCLGRVPSELWP